MIVKILKAGLLSTIQDAGRLKGVEMGLTPSGVMDKYAYEVANALVQNEKGMPVIEVTAGSFSLTVDANCMMAVTGADAEICLGGVRICTWESYYVQAGTVLEISSLSNGFRNYIAIGGQWKGLQHFLHSSATDIRTRIGGISGDKLKTGNVFEVDGHTMYEKMKCTSLDLNYKNQLTQTHKKIRIIKGPQWDAFEPSQQDAFLKNVYSVAASSDRMGIRLMGTPIQHKVKADIITDVVVMGAIQIPGNGEPIIMMADRQVSGGYTKIASVLSSDLSIMAQAKVGDAISFELVDLENCIGLKPESVLSKGKTVFSSHAYKISLSKGPVFEVLVERLVD